MSDLTELLLFAVGILLVVGIGLFIARDARRRAPVADPEHPNAPEQHRRSPAKQRRDRRKAKQARKARRYNRSR